MISSWNNVSHIPTNMACLVERPMRITTKESYFLDLVIRTLLLTLNEFLYTLNLAPQ